MGRDQGQTPRSGEGRIARGGVRDTGFALGHDEDAESRGGAG